MRHATEPRDEPNRKYQMKIQTITGSSIHAALAEARRLLGDDVVLLESVPPAGSEPARITVMIDTVAAQKAPEPEPHVRRAVEEPALLAPAGYGYGAPKRRGTQGVAAEENARLLESFSTAGDGSVQALPASAILHPLPWKIQTITGSSIHAALAEARRLLGDDVVLLESVPPAGSEPARITSSPNRPTA